MSPLPTFLVFGATGYTGRALVRRARAEGLRCVAHLRPNSPSAEVCLPEFESLGAEARVCAWEPEAIAGLVREVDPTHVFGLLGTTRKKARAASEDASYAAVDEGMTRMAIAASATPTAAGARRRFVFLSSLGVREGSANPYIRARATVEAELRRRGEAGALTWTVARPSFITGPDREEARPAERVASVVADGALGALAAIGIRGPRDRFASMDAETLARALRHAATDPAAENQVLETPDLRLRARSN